MIKNIFPSSLSRLKPCCSIIPKGFIRSCNPSNENYARSFTVDSKTKEFEGAITLPKYLKNIIKFKGPISVYEYMRESLTNPLHGYYMHKDVFGEKGDFVTSPEINQIFGEMVAVWTLNEWTKIGKPKPLYIIELGPGRGTMMSDILRIYKRLNLLDEVSCHLVELSPELSRLQAEQLQVELKPSQPDSQCFQSGVTPDGVPVHWYNNLKSIPPSFSTVIAHEFFDALPICKFKKTEHGWKEVLIDDDPGDESGKKFRFVLSPNETPSSRAFVKKTETRTEIEVSPQSGVIMNELATRLEQYGGIALIADYGHDGTNSVNDTFRAFKAHEQQDPLVDPGSADLTADVDFSYLRDSALDKLIYFGPVTQREFLSRMHINVRLESLLKKCPDEETRKVIQSGYDMMLDPKQMGDRFKFMAFFPAVLKPYLEKWPVAGFSDSQT